MSDNPAEWGLRWGVRASFIRYVLGAGGAVSVGAGADWDGERFVFPALAEQSGGVLAYSGEVHDSGVILTAGGAATRIHIARLGAEASAVAAGLLVDAPATLEPDGVALLGSVYPVGTTLEPVTARVDRVRR